MTDQVTHYTDQTTYIKQGVAWLNHCNDYGLIYDTASSSNMGSLTTYADLRAAIAAVVPPVVHRQANDVSRYAIGDNDNEKGELGRVSQILGSTFDTMISTASGQAAGSRLSNLLTALVAYALPDVVPTDYRASFANQR